jgi:dipeptidyl aminopeptidase/acylaminoacyl peptidase
MSGGEARTLTESKSDVLAFEWSPDGGAIAFLSADPLPDEEQRKETKDDAIVSSEAVRPTHLRLLNVETGSIRAVTEGRWRVSAFTWRPDGTGLVIAATDNFLAELLSDRFFTINSDGRAMVELAQPGGPVGKFSVSPDNRYLLYIGSTDGGPIPHGLYLQPLDGGSVRDLSGESLDRRITDFDWVEDGGVSALAEEGFGDVLVHVSIDGSVRDVRRFPDESVAAFDVTGTDIVYAGARADAPQELRISNASGDRQLSQLNEEFAELVAPEMIHYVAEGGVTIEAALFVPTNARKPREGWKTVLLIHGGPSGRWSHKINDWAQLLVARGFAVLAPNIRGSTGYGLDFVRSNRHDWGGADYRDAIAGIDHLIELGLSDPERLAIAGWSYGGYMSAWAITQTDRFKAAVIGAPMTDLAVEYGTELAGINAYDTWYLGTPYEKLDDFVRMSPMTYVKNASTPSLILIGEEDAIDPVGQSSQFYRALTRYGVAAELVIYPREPHTIRERQHRTDVLTRMVDWIERYIDR